MNKKDLTEKVGLSPATVAKMAKGEFVSMQVIYRIGNNLEVDFQDIIAMEKKEGRSWTIKN